MRDVKTVSRRLGFGTAPMPQADPYAAEDNCPLCGNYGALNSMGYCYDRSCKDRARDMLRQEARENGTGIVPGQYYRVGQTELVNLAVFESYSEPQAPIKHPDLCTCDGCDTWARPGDTLCPEHRLQTNAKKYNTVRKSKRTKGRNKKIGNRIKGLDRLSGKGY